MPTRSPWGNGALPARKRGDLRDGSGRGAAVVASDTMVRAGLRPVLGRMCNVATVDECASADVVVPDVWPRAEAEAVCRRWHPRRPAASVVAVVHDASPELATRLDAVLGCKDASPRALARDLLRLVRRDAGRRAEWGRVRRVGEAVGPTSSSASGGTPRRAFLRGLGITGVAVLAAGTTNVAAAKAAGVSGAQESGGLPRSLQRLSTVLSHTPLPLGFDLRRM